MTIKGKIAKDSNFTTVYTDNKVYTIPNNSPSDWGCCEVGQKMANGYTLTQEVYDKWASGCDKEGTFVLTE